MPASKRYPPYQSVRTPTRRGSGGRSIGPTCLIALVQPPVTASVNLLRTPLAVADFDLHASRRRQTTYDLRTLDAGQLGTGRMPQLHPVSYGLHVNRKVR